MSKCTALQHGEVVDSSNGSSFLRGRDGSRWVSPSETLAYKLAIVAAIAGRGGCVALGDDGRPYLELDWLLQVAEANADEETAGLAEKIKAFVAKCDEFLDANPPNGD